MAKAHGGLFRERYGHLRRGDRVKVDDGLGTVESVMVGVVLDKNGAGQPYVVGPGLGLYLYSEQTKKISKREFNEYVASLVLRSRYADAAALLERS